MTSSVLRSCRWSRERGAALLETAIALPLVLLFSVGIFEFGRAFQTWQVLTNAAREGARVAVLPNPATGAVECEPCVVLGIDPLATDEQVREAWLRQVKANHPDRLIAEGLPEEAIAVATRSDGSGTTAVFSEYLSKVSPEWVGKSSKTVNWLKAVANAKTNKPWVLFASFMAPHSPLIAPEEFYSMYPTNAIELPTKKVAYHPWIKAWNDCYRFDSYFESDEQRRIAIASYFGLCTFLDANVGRILQALEETGLEQQTRVVFVSDHGDNLGSRSLWGKSTMYEESAGIPMIAAGAEIPAGNQIQTPVSHVDFFPSILSAVGVPVSEFQDLPGESFFDLMNRPYDSQRTVFSEYHAAGSVSAAYMLRKGKYKYIYYSGFAPELFDLDTDPEEINDLAADPNMHDVLAEFSASLHAICDPQAMDQLAKQDQLALIQANGGEQKILARGGSSYTPIPGEEVKLLSQTI